jgi:hypothetical protein
MLRRFAPLLLLALCGTGCQRPATPAATPGPPPSLTLANFDQVRVGMTLAEVEAILGPPGTTVNSDRKGPDGSTAREVHCASWFWFRTFTPADGGPPREEARRITVELRGGRVSSKEQVGLR